MDPQVFTLAVLGGVVLVLGAFLFVYYLGRGSLQARIDALEAALEEAVAAREEAEARASERAHGARDDFARRAALDAAADADGVLDAAYGPSAPASESGDPGGAGGAGSNAT